ncbi:MAG: arsenic efflux protein [candidate division Zixibacteria bacterium]|nr:arsenic efflux protein [candidate division Zixibacteria bacterium]
MIDSLNTAVMITGFVLLMMLVIEYVNVITRGSWQNSLAKRRWTQYLLAVVLGATPGCMGAFAVVAMFSHRVVSFGALVAAMIATSGDEAFVMLALFPEKALLLTAILVIIAFGVGWLTDMVVSKRVETRFEACRQLEVHESEFCDCFPKDNIFIQWRHLSLARGVLSVALLLFVLGIAIGSIGPQVWDWKRITLLIAGLGGLFITTTVPEHFLQEHLWKHVVLKHGRSIFLWTLGALLVAHIITNQLHLEGYIQANALLVILVACLLGIIPESGPHLFFVTLYAQGTVPFAVLLASSIVQDGHGMLPMLAHSRWGFLLVKGINLFVGLAVGVLVYFGGWL